MRFGERKLMEPYSDVVVFPRQDGPIVFLITAITSFDEHDKLNPMPKAPKLRDKDGKTKDRTDDPNYQKALDEWAHRKMCWIALESMKNSKDLVWEKVQLAEASTWPLYFEELKESFFTDNEILHLQRKIYDVNSLTNGMLEEAKTSFLATLSQQEVIQSSLPEEQPSMVSGQPANG